MCYAVARTKDVEGLLRCTCRSGEHESSPSGRPKSSHVELHALRQGQVVTPIDGARLAAHVGLPCVGTRFATAPRVFLPSERAPDFSPRRADIHVCDSTVAASRREKRLRFG